MSEQKRKIISILVDNQAGVLSKVSGLFSNRGYNIESFSVGTTDDMKISRMTIVALGDDRVLEQIVKQLNKLINVIKVLELPHGQVRERELCYVRVKFPTKNRAEIQAVAHMGGAQVIRVSADHVLFEIVKHSKRVDEFVTLLRPYGIVEVVRGGVVAVAY